MSDKIESSLFYYKIGLNQTSDHTISVINQNIQTAATSCFNLIKTTLIKRAIKLCAYCIYFKNIIGYYSVDFTIKIR